MTERAGYLLIIAGLILAGCYYFSWTTRHYMYLEDKFDIVFSHCK